MANRRLQHKVDNIGMRKRYESDISRERFKEIEALLCGVRHRTKPPTVEKIVNRF
jgi:hypothetical protein